MLRSPRKISCPAIERHEANPTYPDNVDGPLIASTWYIEYKYGPSDFYGNATFIYSNDSVSGIGDRKSGIVNDEEQMTEGTPDAIR